MLGVMCNMFTVQVSDQSLSSSDNSVNKTPERPLTSTAVLA